MLRLFTSSILQWKRGIDYLQSTTHVPKIRLTLRKMWPYHFFIKETISKWSNMGWVNTRWQGSISLYKCLLIVKGVCLICTLYKIVSIPGPTEGWRWNPNPEYQLASRVAPSQLKKPRVMPVDTRDSDVTSIPISGSRYRHSYLRYISHSPACRTWIVCKFLHQA